MKPPRKTHCWRNHEFTPENTYIPPSHPERRICRRCKALTEMIRRDAPAESEEPNIIDVDGVELIVSTEIPTAGPDAHHPPEYHALVDGTDIGQVYQLELIDVPTWFARHPGLQPTGPYPDIDAAFSGLLAS